MGKILRIIVVGGLIMAVAILGACAPSATPAGKEQAQVKAKYQLVATSMGSSTYANMLAFAEVLNRHSKLAEYTMRSGPGTMGAYALVQEGKVDGAMVATNSHYFLYGLCNFVMDSPLSGWPNISAGVRELVDLYGWKIDPEWTEYYPFPEDSRKTILVKCLLTKKGIEKVSFLPVMINRQGQPEVVGRDDPRSAEVLKYMEWLCQDQSLNTRFSREKDEVVIVTG